jgi:peptide deformylase
VLLSRFVVLKIVQAGAPVLRQKARPLTADEIRSAACRQLVELMRQTMHDAPGVGLAAPQIGVGLQLAVIEDREDLLKALDPAALAERDRRPVPFTVIFNPVISIEGTPVEFFEGCLSVTGLSAIVPRAPRVRVECLNHNAEPQVIEATGWHARILQHEIDHLYGTLYIDRMLSRSLMTTDNLARHWKDKTIAEVRRVLEIQ